MKGWFSEVSDEMWPGQAMSLKIEEVLFRGKSDFQAACWCSRSNHGKVLILDGVIQATERDEFSYQEMIAHLPLCLPPPPRQESSGRGRRRRRRPPRDHPPPSVEHLAIAEIDGMVIEMSKKYFPRHVLRIRRPTRPRTRYRWHQVGRRLRGGSSTPSSLTRPIPSVPRRCSSSCCAEKIHRALRPGGVVCTQGECIWLHAELIKDVLEMCKDIFQGDRCREYTTIPARTLSR